MTEFRLIIVYIIRYKCLYLITAKSEVLKNDGKTSCAAKNTLINFPHTTHLIRLNCYFPSQSPR